MTYYRRPLPAKQHRIAFFFRQFANILTRRIHARSAAVAGHRAEGTLSVTIRILVKKKRNWTLYSGLRTGN
jgi:hypothetical protein